LEPTHLLYYTVCTGYWLHLEPTHLPYYTVYTGYWLHLEPTHLLHLHFALELVAAQLLKIFDQQMINLRLEVMG
jgi:hypothetical protein